MRTIPCPPNVDSAERLRSAHENLAKSVVHCSDIARKGENK